VSLNILQEAYSVLGLFKSVRLKTYDPARLHVNSPVVVLNPLPLFVPTSVKVKRPCVVSLDVNTVNPVLGTAQ